MSAPSAEPGPPPPGAEAPLLSVEDVEVAFDTGTLADRLRGRPTRILAVAGVSFEMRSGETFALVGESGSGKTTLARAVDGLQPISAGRIAVEGRDVSAMGSAELKALRRRVAMMFQDPQGSLSPRLSVGALVAEPWRIHGAGGRDLRSEVRRLLRLVGLPEDFAGRYPHQLSGGQARRVGVARAVALEPALVLADEPTAGLDVSVQGEVLNLLADLRERLGLAMLIITHNLHVVRQVADRMGVMYLGRLVETGPAEAIFEAPRHPYTAALLSANPKPDPDRVADRITLPAEVPSLTARPPGCEFHTRCPWARERCRTDPPGPTREGGRAFTCHYPLEPGARPPARDGLEPRGTPWALPPPFPA